MEFHAKKKGGKKKGGQNQDFYENYKLVYRTDHEKKCRQIIM